jgi:hypothetical protein
VLLGVDRMDTWVLRVSIAIPLLCLAALILWHLFTYLAGKLETKPTARRLSPEPPAPIPFSKHPPSVQAMADDPERLQQASTALEDSLAEIYLELAESWLRRGEPQKAAVALKKILQICPERPQAQFARDHLQQIGKEVEDHHS